MSILRLLLATSFVLGFGLTRGLAQTGPPAESTTTTSIAARASSTTTTMRSLIEVGGNTGVCTVTFSVFADKPLLGALSYLADYSEAPGPGFIGSAARVACTDLSGADLPAFNDIDADRVLVSGVIDTLGFETPASLARCLYDTAGETLIGTDIAITVTDASTPDLEPASVQVAADVRCLECSQPFSDGDGPSIVDCLFILRTAVDLELCDPQCICDVNGDGMVSAKDALVCLDNVVRLPADLDCDCNATTTTTSSTTTLAPTTTTTLPPDGCSEDADCDDGLFCTGLERCVSGMCAISPGSPCKALPGFICNEDLNRCVECDADADCDDGQFCTGLEFCNELLECIDGPEPCELGEVCDEEANECGQSTTTTLAPPTTTTLPAGNCGNGTVDPGEDCDGGQCCAEDCTFAPAETPCGSSEDTDCSNPDSCNGMGQCFARNEPDGTACTTDPCGDAATCEGGDCVCPVTTTLAPTTTTSSTTTTLPMGTTTTTSTTTTTIGPRPLELVDDFENGNILGWTVREGDIDESDGFMFADINSNNSLATMDGQTGTAIAVDAVAGPESSYVALVYGFSTVLDNLFVKIQDNDSNGLFDRVFFYHGNDSRGVDGENGLVGQDIFPLSSEVSSTYFQLTDHGDGTVSVLVEATGDVFGGTTTNTYAGATVGSGFEDGGKADNFYVGVPSTTTTMPADDCGNGTVDPGEDCDGGQCCAEDCTFAPAETPCGSSEDTDCSNPDSCNAMGQCFARNESDGTACSTDPCGSAATCQGGQCTCPTTTTTMGQPTTTTLPPSTTTTTLGGSEPNEACLESFCATDATLRQQCDAFLDECLMGGDFTDDECIGAALFFCDGGACGQDFCATDELLAQDCEDFLEECLMMAANPLDQEACVGAAVLKCSEEPIPQDTCIQELCADDQEQAQLCEDFLAACEQQENNEECTGGGLFICQGGFCLRDACIEDELLEQACREFVQECLAAAEIQPDVEACFGAALGKCDNVGCTSDAECDDGVFCNGAEECNIRNECDDGNEPCGPREICIEETDSCIEEP